MEGYDLHEDIVVEILCRLPKKSLARFKCVCKQWLNLISDGNRVFPKTTHLGFACQSGFSRTIFFYRVGSDGSASVARSLSGIEQSGVLRSTCNGFLLFVKEGRRRGLEGEEYVVCHPATERYWHLVPPVIRHTIHVGLAAAGDRHFSLVRVFSVLGESSFATDVFSSRDECWKEDPWPPACDVPRYNAGISERGNSVFFGGSLHWIWMDFLLIYHLENGGACEILSLPKVPNGGRSIDPCDHRIWESEGCLSYCCVYCRGRIGIWTLHRKTSRSSKCSNCSFVWKVKHKGALGAPVMVGRRPVACSPVAFNEEFAIVYLMSRRKVFSYNIVTRESKEACKRPFEGCDKRAGCIAFPFLYLTQFDIADSMAADDGELCDASSGEMVKQRKLL